MECLPHLASMGYRVSHSNYQIILWWEVTLHSRIVYIRTFCVHLSGKFTIIRRLLEHFGTDSLLTLLYFAQIYTPPDFRPLPRIGLRLPILSLRNVGAIPLLRTVTYLDCSQSPRPRWSQFQGCSSTFLARLTNEIFVPFVVKKKGEAAWKTYPLVN